MSLIYPILTLDYCLLSFSTTHCMTVHSIPDHSNVILNIMYPTRFSDKSQYGNHQFIDIFLNTKKGEI
jgi:hypothetical protein